MVRPADHGAPGRVVVGAPWSAGRRPASWACRWRWWRPRGRCFPAWSLADIGGGSMEIAYGTREDPDVALSLPLGAGRLRRQCLSRQEEAFPAAARACRVSAGRTEVSLATAPTRVPLWPRPGPSTNSPGCAARRRARADLTPRVRCAGTTFAQSSHSWPARHLRNVPGFLIGAPRQPDHGRRDRRRRHNCRPGPTYLRICPWALREGVLLGRLHLREDIICSHTG
ncbi:hypothetical protein [Nonomuraea sp. NPDC049625]|uniref:Ppx/GppA phosphatase family protein n=1 Tax=Nonomuraea sp. NPDC049625 TaxID=3155775 RepID=UPI003447D359